MKRTYSVMSLTQPVLRIVWLVFASLAIQLATACGAEAGVIFQDSFESRDLSLAQNGFTWSRSAKAKVVNSNPNTGSYSLLFPYPGDGAGNPESPDSWAEQRFTLGGRYTELWFKFDIYFPSNYTHRNGENNKFLILWNDTGGDSSAASKMYIDLESWGNVGSTWGAAGSSYTALHLKYNNIDRGHDHPSDVLYGQTPDQASVFRAPDDRGKWHEFIFHFKLASSSNSGDGVAEVWKNGLKEMEYLHLNNYTPGANYIDRGYLLGWANSGFNELTNVYVDNFVVSTSPIMPSVSAASQAGGAGGILLAPGNLKLVP